ncbi:MAG: hypothetical protein K2X66_13180, partial [Cyanobacteria bacterium]|nr:hypothetical protein [Cyanobacteriota bacterium]
VKEHYKPPAELAACIESQGTPVYVLPKGHPIHVLMSLMGFEPGFIPPNGSKQFKTLVTCLKFLCPKGGITKDILCIKGFFLLTRPVFTVGYIAHQLHHWLAYSSGLPGYGEMDQSLYKTFWEKHHGVITQRDAEKMDVDEIIRLKNAINRDMEALKFMKNLMQELFTPASQGHNLANGTARA